VGGLRFALSQAGRSLIDRIANKRGRHNKPGEAMKYTGMPGRAIAKGEPLGPSGNWIKKELTRSGMNGGEKGGGRGFLH